MQNEPGWYREDRPAPHPNPPPATTTSEEPMGKPHINPKPGADQYAAGNERIIEFSASDGRGAGGLISVRQGDDGSLTVEVYRADRTAVMFSGPDS